MWRRSPGGGGGSGGMVAHDLVNGWQAEPDGMSEANLQRRHPRRGVFTSPRTEQVGMEPKPAFSTLSADY